MTSGFMTGSGVKYVNILLCNFTVQNFTDIRIVNEIVFVLICESTDYSAEIIIPVFPAYYFHNTLHILL